jgi:hypothetical protein
MWHLNEGMTLMTSMVLLDVLVEVGYLLADMKNVPFFIKKGSQDICIVEKYR